MFHQTFTLIRPSPLVFDCLPLPLLLLARLPSIRESNSISSARFHHRLHILRWPSASHAESLTCAVLRVLPPSSSIDREALDPCVARDFDRDSLTTSSIELRTTPTLLHRSDRVKASSSESAQVSLDVGSATSTDPANCRAGARVTSKPVKSSVRRCDSDGLRIQRAEGDSPEILQRLVGQLCSFLEPSRSAGQPHFVWVELLSAPLYVVHWSDRRAQLVILNSAQAVQHLHNLQVVDSPESRSSSMMCSNCQILHSKRRKTLSARLWVGPLTCSSESPSFSTSFSDPNPASQGD